MQKTPLIAILITCFNRRETTLSCLASIESAISGSADYKVVIVDDGSSDGTADAVRAAYPDAVVAIGSGNLYWNGGMRMAWQNALQLHADFYLWLNDDTILRPGAIRDMLSKYDQENFAKTIVVGCTVDPETKQTTYGGYRRSTGLSRLRLRRLWSNEQYCDTMNGNCVLFPKTTTDDIGINSHKFTHAFGDNDYGLRAIRAGYRIVELKDAVAEQTHNAEFVKSTSTLTYANWRKILLHPKGVPVVEWWAFCREHGGPIWPVNFFWRYIKMLRLRAG
ncbi:glycosyltransferase family 2 protein [Neorhizobium lilium]|uniref:Glycosyltransferase family 2 protein n=1 Tax=Neorhizobium lilium TaxID=2503024 RepID=A0A3S3S510_9HYPH|nr:glycosyltransferase family 2 protein [Neorhizobium lilium]RWX76939.1 glycosyltransferase family 2 protein [Neorhizobium lilium]